MLGLIELLGYVIGIVIALGAVYNAIGDKNRAAVTRWLANWTTAGVEAAIPVLTVLEATVEPIVRAFIASIERFGPPILADVKDPAAAMAGFALKTATDSLEANRDITPDQWVKVAGDAMADAFGFGLGSFSVAAAFEACFPEKLNTLDGLAPMLATLSGFDEVTKAALQPVLMAGISLAAGYDANSKFRARLPSAGQAAEMLSRRVITQAQYDTLVAYSGIAKTWEGSLAGVAYRPLSPMMLAAGFANADVDMAKLQSALEYMGIRPQDLPLAEQAVITRSLQQTRQALVNEAVTAYGQGVVADAELSQILTDAGYGKAASALVMQRALLARRITLARESESYIVPEVAQALISPDEGLQALEAAGVQPWQAQLKITLAETRGALSAARKAAAQERKLELQRQRNLTRAAVAEYERGVLDDAGLTAALIALGLDGVLVGTIVAVENAKQAGRLRLVFGQLLTPSAAKVLEDQVAALETQFKKQLIDEQNLRAQLTALKVDGPEIEALVARWAAARTAATKTGYLLPV